MRISFTPRAEKDLEKLDNIIQQRIRDKLYWFMGQLDPLVFAKPIHDSEAGNLRFLVGDYRILFEVIGDIIYVHRIGHRSEIYRD